MIQIPKILNFEPVTVDRIAVAAESREQESREQTQRLNRLPSYMMARLSLSLSLFSADYPQCIEYSALCTARNGRADSAKVMLTRIWYGTEPSLASTDVEMDDLSDSL